MKSVIGWILARAWCQGYFSKDYDLEGAIIQGAGRDWIVVRLKDGTPRFQYFNWPRKEINRQLKEWTKPLPEIETV